MIKRLLSLSAILAFSLQTHAQVYSYNFGTIVDSITSGSTTSPTFLSAPADGGVAYARVGTGGGKIAVRSHPGFGNGSSMRIQAPTGGSVNKFSIHTMPGASTTLGLKLDFSIGDSVNSTNPVTSGTLYFFTGNGATFSGASTFSGSQTFGGIRLTLGATSATMSVRVPLPPPLSGYTWYSDPTNPVMVPYGVTTTVALYINNGTGSVTYTDINNASRSLPAGTADLFANGVYQGNIPSAGLAQNTNVNSFMFYAENSSGNQANLFIDNIAYSNNIVANPLPIKLSYFDAGAVSGGIRLNWKSEVETGVSSFAIEHSKDGIQFTGIGNVPAKQINGSAYSFLHDSPGLDNYYRLKIMNTNGSADYSQVVVVKAVSLPSDMRAWYMDNAIRVAQHGDAQITIYDLNGRKVLSGILGSSDYAVDVSFLAPGSYVAHVSGMNGTATVKFVR